MATNDSAEYWRSEDGGEAYDQALDTHFQHLFEKCKGVELVRRMGVIDIYVMHDYPFAETSTFITKGVSGFILDTEERIELAITLRQHYSKDWAADLLKTLIDATLGNRRPLKEYSIVGNVDFKGIGSAVSVQHLMVMLGHWFEKDDFHIPNFYPGHIFELVPVLDSEARLAYTDVDEFYRRGRGGLIDTLDLCRPDVREIH